MPWNMSVARCASLAALWVVWSRKWSFCPRWSIHFLSIYGSRFRVSVQHTHIRTHALARTFTFVRTYVMWHTHTYANVGGGATCLVRGGSHRSWLAIKMQMNYVHFFWCQTIHLCSLPPYLVRSSTSLILRPFICLLSPFADEEDLFMVCDLLTGGDLRYHLQNRVSVFFVIVVVDIIRYFCCTIRDNVFLSLFLSAGGVLREECGLISVRAGQRLGVSADTACDPQRH